MTEKPILFSTPMVRAILNTKTNTWPPEPIDASKPCKGMTRRVVVPQPECITDKGIYIDRKGSVLFQNKASKLGKYQVGNVLWVREKFQIYPIQEFLYKSGEMNPYEKIPKQRPESYYVEYAAEQEAQMKWRPSRHMPRWVARLFLKVRGVRVERLQDISNEDAKKEGFDTFNVNADCDYICDCEEEGRCAICGFRYVWDSLNAKRGYSWESNPFVWVYEFARVEQ
jgi:hypothetical protein